jgi:hypothetical protein
VAKRTEDGSASLRLMTPAAQLAQGLSPSALALPAAAQQKLLAYAAA